MFLDKSRPALPPARQPRVQRPETLAQAVECDRRSRAYRAAGLCCKCSAQAAWGHSIGFTRVHPPCPACVLVVTSFPLAAPNGWRRHGRARLAAHSDGLGSVLGPERQTSPGATSTAVPGVLAHA